MDHVGWSAVGWQNPSTWAVLLIATGTVAFFGMSLAHTIMSRMRGQTSVPGVTGGLSLQRVQQLTVLVNQDLAQQRAPVNKISGLLGAGEDPDAGTLSTTTSGLIELERFIATDLARHLVMVSDEEVVSLAHRYRQSVLQLRQLIEPSAIQPASTVSTLEGAWEAERSVYEALSRRVNELARTADMA